MHRTPIGQFVVVVLLIVCVIGLSSFSARGQQYPFPQHVTYASGSILPSGTRQQLDNDVKAFYDDWKEKYVRTATVEGQFRARVRDNNGADRTVSEGQGYGMLLTAYMAGYDSQAQTLFDGMYRYAKAYPVPAENRLMIWLIFANGTAGDRTSAFDGDADIAYALIVAAKQWGNSGSINYTQAALDWLEGIAVKTIGSNTHLPLLGSWVPAAHYSERTPRSSDFMYGHFRAWARFQDSRQSFWLDVLEACQDVAATIQANEGSATGLLPDFIEYNEGLSRYVPADPGFMESPNDGFYFYNAGRDPWRIAVDALLSGNGISRAQAIKMSDWIQTKYSGNAANMRSGWALNGSHIGDYFSTFFAAPFGVAAMLQSSQQAWLDSIYNAVKNTQEDYYEDTVNLLCLLVMSGNWWDPTTIDGGDGTGDGAGDGADDGADGDGAAAQLRSWAHLVY